MSLSTGTNFTPEYYLQTVAKLSTNYLIKWISYELIIYVINCHDHQNIILIYLQDKFSNRTKYLTTIIISNCINKFIWKIKYETFLVWLRIVISTAEQNLTWIRHRKCHPLKHQDNINMPKLNYEPKRVDFTQNWTSYDLKLVLKGL